MYVGHARPVCTDAWRNHTRYDSIQRGSKLMTDVDSVRRCILDSVRGGDSHRAGERFNNLNCKCIPVQNSVHGIAHMEVLGTCCVDVYVLA